MIALLVVGLIAVIIAVDAYRRKSSIVWSIAALVMGPLVIPFYLAFRNLLPGEKRVGGKPWTIARYLSLTWTFVVLGVALMWTTNLMSIGANSDAEAAGVALGFMLGAFVLFLVWLVPVSVAMAVGGMLRDGTNIEIGKGPDEDDDSRAIQ